jgi:hypothetical protein
MSEPSIKVELLHDASLWAASNLHEDEEANIKTIWACFVPQISLTHFRR